MERLSTEKQTLGFFGALTGVMISQLPEFRLGENFTIISAGFSMIAIMALVLSTGFIRRGLGEVTNIWMIICVLGFFSAVIFLSRSELSYIYSHGIESASSVYKQSLSLKMLIVGYLVGWAALTHLDK